MAESTTHDVQSHRLSNAVKCCYLVAALAVAFVPNCTIVYNLHVYAKRLSFKTDLVDPWNLVVYHDAAYSKITFLMVVFLTISCPRD
jgi:hypothetical protein